MVRMTAIILKYRRHYHTKMEITMYSTVFSFLLNKIDLVEDEHSDRKHSVEASSQVWSLDCVT